MGRPPFLKAVVVLAALFTAVNAGVTYPTPLQKFVWTDDGSFKWFVAAPPFRNEHSTTYFLNVTTTKWLTPAKCSVPVWTCRVWVTVPDILDPTVTDWTGIYIDEATLGHPKKLPDLIGVILSETLNSVFVHLYDVPNAPIVFADDPQHRERIEDELLAWGWLHFLKYQKDTEWLVRLPMVKSVVKAMDAVQLFLPTINVTKPTKFMIAGASKRGWVTWLTPAVDARVQGIVPIVMPVLNMVTCLNNMWRSLGEWTFAFSDYVDLGIPNWLFTPQFAAMADIIDPINYMPYLANVTKYLMFATGDEFFLVDSTRNFYPKMLKEGGETHLRMMEDADHALLPLDLTAIYDIAAFAELLYHGVTRPSLVETITYSNSTASIRVVPSSPPDTATLWQATTFSKIRRDFRFINCTQFPQCFQPVFWLPADLKPNPDGSYSAAIAAPEDGWIGFMIELTFVSPFNPTLITYTITSQVNVVPDAYPFGSWQPPSPPPFRNRQGKSLGRHLG